MNEETPKDNESELEPSEAVAPEVTAPEAAAPEVEAPREPSRLGRFARRALRWLVVLLAAFALGLAATWVARVRPQAERIQALEAEKAALESQVADLEAEVAELRPLRAENADLKEQLRQAETKSTLLSVLVDVTSAQLALAQDDSLAARAALAETDARLATLQRDLSGQDAEAVGAMRDRLDLVLQELDDDAFAAQRDLEVLTNSLVALKKALFGE